MKKVTFKEISRIVGVSPMHVSRALAGHPYVKEELRREISKVAKKLNYSINPFGRGLSKNIQMKARMICVLTKYGNFFRTEYFVNLIDAISSNCRAKGYDVIIASLTDDESGNIKRLKNLVSYYKAGIIEGFVFIAPDLDAAEGFFLRAEKVNFVCAGSRIDAATKYVDVDNFRAGSEVGGYLIRLGHRRIAFVKGLEKRRDSRERQQGFLNALTASRIAPDESLFIAGDYSIPGGKKATAELFSRKKKPDAIFYANDLMAYGGLEFFKEKKIRVPREISIVGFDDLAASSRTEPPLTTARQPYKEMGEAVMEAVSRPEFASRMITAKLIIRKSCDNPRRRG
ncbi:MAG: LacI family DNA-binding transcriptional regulator [Candidatus Omnitrophica bacterium]|nr:LacI family DNA-binding transcriptional regulator [Candidatus Omnitrophota bacterium]